MKAEPGADRPVVWEPQPKQGVFLSRWEDEALYGGAAGGGKSDALVIEALRQVEIPHYRGLILRRTYPQLEDLIGKSELYYPAAFPGAKFNESKHCWIFPSSAKIFFGSMQHEKDKYNYQGKPYDYIAFDELTQFEAPQYDYLKSRNRPNGPGTRCYIRATANPGGVGHGWVKARFITPAPPMTSIPEKVTWKDDTGAECSRTMWRIFVPASVFDNPAMTGNDPSYVPRLASLPEAERQALLYGSWDSFSGQVFTEWRNLPEHYGDRTGSHVIDPFPIPADWKVERCFDWGYAKPFACYWAAVDRRKRKYIIRELYGCTGDPNTGVKWTPDEVADRIRQIEEQDPNLKGRKIFGVADPAVFGDQFGHGTSIAAMMEHKGVYWDRGDNSRISGKMQVHNHLAFDENGVPMLYVFAACRNLIRTLPDLCYDETDVEDVDTSQEDHAYDALRYLLMDDPIAPPVKKKIEIPEFDPLDLNADKRPGRYDWYHRTM